LRAGQFGHLNLWNWCCLPNLSHLNLSGSRDNCLNCPASARIISSFNNYYCFPVCKSTLSFEAKIWDFNLRWTTLVQNCYRFATSVPCQENNCIDWVAHLSFNFLKIQCYASRIKVFLTFMTFFQGRLIFLHWISDSLNFG